MTDHTPSSGIPLKEEYDALLRSATFRHMESFSEGFLTRNRRVLSRYMAKWGVENPLHSWSRRWEYPYVWSRVAEAAKSPPTPRTAGCGAHVEEEDEGSSGTGTGSGGGGLRVLDAGSGATFLPFYIKHRFDEATVACCDTDPKLTDVFSAMNGIMDSDVEFSVADIRRLPYGDRSFDLVCCISVLEHTRDHEDIIAELARVLVDGGQLVITFDVGLDGTRDMRVQDLERFLKVFSSRFRESSAPESYVMRRLSDPAILTTHAVNARLLSWKGPPVLHRIKSSLVNRRIVGWPPLLTVCCMTGRLAPVVPEE